MITNKARIKNPPCPVIYLKKSNNNLIFECKNTIYLEIQTDVLEIKA